MSALLELALLAHLALAPAPAVDMDCGQHVCLYANDSNGVALSSEAAGTWQSGERLSRNARRKSAKKNKKRKPVALRVNVEGGRGTVFVDGRFLATTGTYSQRELKPGKHEVEVRDGDKTLAMGTLTIKRKAGALTLVVHADR